MTYYIQNILLAHFQNNLIKETEKISDLSPINIFCVKLKPKIKEIFSVSVYDLYL